jgi:hypothetical protein
MTTPGVFDFKVNKSMLSDKKSRSSSDGSREDVHSLKREVLQDLPNTSQGSVSAQARASIAIDQIRRQSILVDQNRRDKSLKAARAGSKTSYTSLGNAASEDRYQNTVNVSRAYENESNRNLLEELYKDYKYKSSREMIHEAHPEVEETPTQKSMRTRMA